MNSSDKLKIKRKWKDSNRIFTKQKWVILDAAEVESHIKLKSSRVSMGAIPVGTEESFREYQLGMNFYGTRLLYPFYILCFVWWIQTLIGSTGSIMWWVFTGLTILFALNLFITLGIMLRAYAKNETYLSVGKNGINIVDFGMVDWSQVNDIYACEAKVLGRTGIYLMIEKSTDEVIAMELGTLEIPSRLLRVISHYHSGSRLAAQDPEELLSEGDLFPLRPDRDGRLYHFRTDRTYSIKRADNGAYYLALFVGTAIITATGITHLKGLSVHDEETYTQVLLVLITFFILFGLTIWKLILPKVRRVNAKPIKSIRATSHSLFIHPYGEVDWKDIRFVFRVNPNFSDFSENLLFFSVKNGQSFIADIGGHEFTSREIESLIKRYWQELS